MNRASEHTASAAGSTLDTPLWVVVPAAGVGNRLSVAGSGDPSAADVRLAKQYRLLDGITMLERSLNAMLAITGVAGVVVVLGRDDVHWQTLEASRDTRVHTTQGGDIRAASVRSGTEYVMQHARPDTWVMVHDAARPLVSASDIQRLINAVYNSGAPGGLLATPVHDTLKKADEYASVIDTVERRNLWQAQTPQLFRAGALHDALCSALDSNAAAVTDEASAMELAGHQPLLVEALQPNFKITRPVDWQLATALLQSQRSAHGQTTA